MNLSEEFFDALNYQGFVYLSDGQFEMINSKVGWFDSIVLEAAKHSSVVLDKKSVRYPLAELIPYIDNFLIDAKLVWSSTAGKSIESGVWTEKGNDNNEYQLSAKAFLADNNKYLLIENISEHFPEKQRVYQRMRELTLINEKLIVELNRRQRSLQKEILKTIEQKASMKDVKETYQHSATAVMICQQDGSVEVTNNALINIYQPEDDEPSRYQSMLDRWISEAEVMYPEMKGNIEAGRYWEGNFKTTAFDNSQKWIQLSIAPVWGDDMRVNHFVCIAYDLSEYKRTESDIDEYVEFDLTTKMPNRRYFWRKLEEKKIASDANGESFALLLIDIDNFKQLNEEFGHYAADNALISIAGRIVSSVKHSDFVAHLGGDEYALILNTGSESADAELVAKRILTVVSEPMVIDDSMISLSCSIGITYYETFKIGNNQLFKQADLALYYAKEQGKNSLQIFHQRLEQRPQYLKQVQELRSAFLQRQFELYYQPQIAYAEEEDYRVEALLRWKHPEKGLLLPTEFIGLLEKSGLIVPLGNWVMRQACRDIRRLLDDGIPIKVAINISAKQLNHDHFYDELKRAIDKVDIPADRIELEITEHCFVGEEGNAVELLEKVRDLNVAIAIDDFGSGYSSLSYLKKLPVDILKIDRSFVTELPDEPESKAIIVSIIQLAHALNLKVVAEGVENERQLNFLLEKDCHFIQGFLFSEAVELEVLPDTLRRLRIDAKKYVIKHE